MVAKAELGDCEGVEGRGANEVDDGVLMRFAARGGRLTIVSPPLAIVCATVSPSSGQQDEHDEQDRGDRGDKSNSQSADHADKTKS
ncbi:GM23161 [Drosophila sechellia]|uniref:GM23161 n=1 Tax=Drosophila sechellia TaxID=7238 RepID=B4II76_DROSE|nr:GM23161 [Drosophila sechellia]